MAVTEAIQLLYTFADEVMTKTQSALPLDVVADFVDTVRWREPFILGVIIFHIIVLLWIILTRTRHALQLGTFMVIGFLVLGARALNDLGKANWASFATQDYFDRSGLFMMVFFSGPLLFSQVVILIQLLMAITNLAALSYRSKLIAQARQRRVHASSNGNGHHKTE
mmetsp:Transcript_10978/g.21895  ORF Transcript_10978/g.21895 Transcript_10978/m.21895 type:complete len:167 (-) Transcript_10978:446-946(-)